MPKGNKKRKPGSRKLDISDDDSFNDNASITSSVAASSIWNETNFGDSDDEFQVQLIEEKLCEYIDDMTLKSSDGRINSIDAISKILMKKMLQDFIINRRMTISDYLEKCFKKGKSVEQISAARLLALLAVQLGATNFTDELCQRFIPIMMSIVTDGSATLASRSKCCWAVGILVFIGEYDEALSIMTVLQQMFTKSLSSTTTNKVDMSALQSAAISAWCLIYTVTSIPDSSYYPTLNHLKSLLESNSLEVRLVIGELIVLQMEKENGGKYSDNYELSDELFDKLKQLSSESSKNRNKKDRKTQRSTYRDIIRYIEDNEFPSTRIKFGMEMLTLDSWRRKKHYDSFCEVLASGMNYHLSENSLLRDVLSLGEKVSPLNMEAQKQLKDERHIMNAATYKARSIRRAQGRDLRSAANMIM